MKDFAECFEKGLNYPEYQELAKKLLSENKTSGNNQSQEMVDFSKLNIHRVERILKKGSISLETQAAIQAIDSPSYILAISEFWCGDAAQNLPWIYLMVKDNPAIQFRIVFRDENPELMDAFLTNGSKSIPKVILLNAEREVCGTWGPRPSTAQNLILENKMTNALTKDDLHKKLHLWYAQNEGQEIQSEFCSLLERCTKAYI
jgi:UDP:flavonoid glycosyltransferase YjiC (YdhE family)